MKKVLVLFLSLMLCLSLCACGGMSGEKAAGMYPDIIGQWGTDPFGEEFVLTLSKDGSCSILDTPGIWTLDEKRSNEAQVVLNIQTDSMKYYLELDRIRKDREVPSLYCNLLIMDSKKKTEIYNDYVFATNGNFVMPDLAMHTVPELIGEWGTYYWTEEPVLTIREDGTCSVLRQPGKWCLLSFASTWREYESVGIYVKLENGQYYEIDCMAKDYLDYKGATFDIYGPMSGCYFITDPNSVVTPYHIINRSRVDSPFEIAHSVLGSWVDSESGNSMATFNDDGTCTLRGAEGIWTVQYDYTSYFDSSWKDNETLSLVVKINDREYDVTMFSEENENFLMRISEEGVNGVEILPFTDVVKSTD